MSDPASIHSAAIVIDGVCPLAEDPSYLDWYRQGGVTALAPTVGGWEGARATLGRLAKWSHLFNMRSDLLLARKAADIGHAKRTGRLGLFLHFQGADPIEDDLDLVDLYRELGVGVVQLTYNVRNRVGDGCEEPSDAGLSRFGRQLIRRLNEAKVIVDCAHTGLRTSLEAIEESSAPVILSHANAQAIHDVPRNVPDELIRAIAASGGIIGVNGFPGFLANVSRPSLEQLIEHIDHIAQIVGVDHVGLGLDYYAGQAGVAPDEVALAAYEREVRAGRWSPRSYPRPPHYYPSGIETPRTLQNLTAALRVRGYSEDDVTRILGANWLRVMHQVWG
jgi:membrane dipeptidase